MYKTRPSATGLGGGRHSGLVSERGRPKISVQVVVRGGIFEQKTGSEGRSCCMGEEGKEGRSGTPVQMWWLLGEIGGWI